MRQIYVNWQNSSLGFNGYPWPNTVSCSIHCIGHEFGSYAVIGLFQSEVSGDILFFVNHKRSRQSIGSSRTISVVSKL
ncbi:uncharacterized protein METZ01_LOCUS169523, partial [marine metagenome]